MIDMRRKKTVVQLESGKMAGGKREKLIQIYIQTRKELNLFTLQHKQKRKINWKSLILV